MVIVDGKITTAELLYDDAVAIRVLSHLSELVKHTADLNDTAANFGPACLVAAFFSSGGPVCLVLHVEPPLTPSHV
jgi:hypothetical protein